MSEHAVKFVAKPEAKPIKPKLEGVKKIIAVASGKGGVGKSTTASNLACALQREGKRVGLLDADIYGPNLPLMMGSCQAPTITPDKKFVPVLCHGVQCMSIGYLVDANEPMIWRGPMVSKAFQQLIFDTLWENLDYLVIDLPPGTGDVQLTLIKKVSLNGAIIVTTPQDVAVADAKKGVGMFEKLNIPVLGIVENMSGYVCTHCGHSESIFAHSGGQRLAEESGVPLLAEIPLDTQICQQADRGMPVVVAAPKSDISLIYHRVARAVVAAVSNGMI